MGKQVSPGAKPQLHQLSGWNPSLEIVQQSYCELTDDNYLEKAVLVNSSPDLVIQKAA